MQSLGRIIGYNDLLAYLTMMTMRLMELKRVLKEEGSLYLHCDPTTSHYLKIVLDVIFGKKSFKNEIVWSYKRWTAIANRFQRMHDIIFFYTKGSQYKFTPLLVEYTDNEAHYTEKDKKGEYRWQYLEGKKYKLYKKEGIRMGDVWEIPYLNPMAKERLGYPTQKPESLLERIINASSKEGDWILDPFCGCGTTVAVAEKLNRRWVGIDITTLAINLVKYRLRSQFGLGNNQIHLDGLPTDLAGAKELFKKDPWQFEYWALDLVNAVPTKSKEKSGGRGADKGVDGVIIFHKNVRNGNSNGNGQNRLWEYGKVIVQVKGGKVQRSQIATLKSDAEREGAEGGIFITLEEPTQPMKEEAMEAGAFMTPLTGKFEFHKIQIFTIQELLRGKSPNLPRGLVKNYYKEASPAEQEKNHNNQAVLGL
jgi:site-specific DNA-methyltransferase (adenine-specific)